MAVIISGPFAYMGFFCHLHFHIIVSPVFIPGDNIKPYPPVFRMVDHTFFFADLHLLDGKSHCHLQKITADFLVHHNCAKHKIILK